MNESPRELLLADMVARIEEARQRLLALEREYKFARMIPGQRVSWREPQSRECCNATVVRSTAKSILIDLGDRKTWVLLDSLELIN